ncbi:MAG TPA: manganese efflux pump MntP family protein [Desulfobacteria bacterium]|nr:manganese efflux pump MntP family protein [Desulfobacteria bacterium]
MGLYTVLALALALSADAFSFSLGLGMTGVTKRQIILLSLTVLVFHIVMPLGGYFIGGIFGSFLGRSANILGALVLIFLGLRMIWDSFTDKEDNFSKYVLSSTSGIVVMSATVSLDALSVGFTLGTQRVSLGTSAAVIGLVAGLMTFLGLGFGQKAGELIGNRAVIIGGLILVYIGINLFI